MRLSDLIHYGPVTIQCHDNPDADALGSGYGLYCYFRSRGLETRLIYSGFNTVKKSNLCLMLDELEIPVEYVEPDPNAHFPGLLITVDCQYGAGNVTRFSADTVAVIDHHPIEHTAEGLPKLNRVQTSLGSCATLVWLMLKEEDYPLQEDTRLGTALVYGLYMDTNQFAELYSPLDLDMRESVPFNRQLMVRFRNANISLSELEIAGIAMQGCRYNEEHRFAIIKAKPCDPNILGLICDFLLQVAEIDKCVVYNEINDGYKISVRSCVREFSAKELAAFLTKDIGSGGGHFEKAGGFISARRYAELWGDKPILDYFAEQMIRYFLSYEIIQARDYEADFSTMKKYRRKTTVACIQSKCMVDWGNRVTIRTLEDNIERIVDVEAFFALERDGTVHAMTNDRFHRYLAQTGEIIPGDYFQGAEYIPHFKNSMTEEDYDLQKYARICEAREEFVFYAKPIERATKVFSVWDDEHYMLGLPGDFLAVSIDDPHNLFVEGKEHFFDNFEEC